MQVVFKNRLLIQSASNPSCQPPKFPYSVDFPALVHSVHSQTLPLSLHLQSSLCWAQLKHFWPQHAAGCYQWRYVSCGSLVPLSAVSATRPWVLVPSQAIIIVGSIVIVALNKIITFSCWWVPSFPSCLMSLGQPSPTDCWVWPAASRPVSLIFSAGSLPCYRHPSLSRLLPCKPGC